MAGIAKRITTVNPKARKVSSFGFHAEGKKLLSPNSKSITVEHQNQCAMTCNRSPVCRSFNFCGRTLCDLHTDDVYSTEMGEAILQEDSNCIYVSMEKDESPVCQEGGRVVDIRSDVMFKFCRIKDKRVDKEWGEWESEVLDTGEDYKEFKMRVVTVEAAHGGHVGSEEHERVNYWLKFVHEKKSWDDASDGCEQMNGSLFSDVDGTKAQLKGFREKLQNAYWLGIYTEDHNVWKNVEDQPIPSGKLRWDKGQPNNKNGNQFWVMAISNDYLHDEPETNKLKSICRLK